MRIFYKNIYWNAILHFSKYNLPYDFFLPYKNDFSKYFLINKKVKIIQNPN